MNIRASVKRFLTVAGIVGAVTVGVGGSVYALSLTPEPVATVSAGAPSAEDVQRSVQVREDAAESVTAARDAAVVIRAAADAETARIAAEVEAARVAAEVEAARIEAERVAAEQAAAAAAQQATPPKSSNPAPWSTTNLDGGDAGKQEVATNCGSAGASMLPDGTVVCAG